MKILQLPALCWMLCLLAACGSKNTLFRKIPSSHSGITFDNRITETDSLNPIDVVNLYNGGGVGIGDFNQDGLADIYFTGNMVPSKLYLNKGDFRFQDITKEAGVDGMGRWGRGVAVVDINNDGLTDIYICNTIYNDSLRRRNILYVNQGNDSKGIPHFRDMAAEYGLDVHVQSTMANFFDYDNDGDLDVYITVNEASKDNNPSAFGTNRNKNVIRSLGRLLRNDPDPVLGHAVFHDVTVEAGMNREGFAHAATIADLNRDGWSDIYVSNDFISDNILYINNHDGTFTDRSKDYFKHTALNAMGQDVIDINNDGLADVFELDMSPPDNYRRKMMLNANNYNTIQNFITYGHQFQYIRNVLQLNQGARPADDTTGIPVFSDVGFMSGVALTDWSWDPLITDFDNDSYRDIIVTNGFPKDVSDHDFIAYRQQTAGLVSREELLSRIPEIKLHNFAFRNKHGFLFDDVSGSWGFDEPSFSNGGAYADLDNDGDLDLVINNIDDEAFVYRNTTRERNDTASNYLQVNLEGGPQNRDGLGATVAIHYDHGKQQFFENTPYRGYLSTNQRGAHFGLGNISEVDSIVVGWPGGSREVIRQVRANQSILVDIRHAGPGTEPSAYVNAGSLFRDLTRDLGINFVHKQVDFVDFNIQTTLPHKLSEYSPALAAGDLDGNGLDDLVVGGNTEWRGKIFLQQPDGKFLMKDLEPLNDSGWHEYTEGGLLLFDANGDGFPDIFAAGSGNRFKENSPGYQDRLYINDGKGRFTLAKEALPVNHTSKLCVRSADINNDGKPDLFISGRVDAWHYPRAVSSFIYRNDSENGIPKFTDVTSEWAPALADIGMVCDALFTDFDNDDQVDLLLAGEWMPITFLKNNKGHFENVTTASGLGEEFGWWNSIVAGDFRHTGRMDYIVGNLGTNSFYKASHEYPIYVTAKDFMGNGGYEAILSVYLPDQQGRLREFPAHGRDDIVDKLPVLKKKFNDYHRFAVSTLDEVLSADQRQDAIRLKMNNARSCYLRNDGEGRFTMIPLPDPAQMSVVNAMVVDDFDGDNELDVLINGNDFGTEVSTGRYDGMNGLILKGNGKGEFQPISIAASGIYIPGNGKSLVRLRGAGGKYLVAASQNRGPLKVFGLSRAAKTIGLEPGDREVLFQLADGKPQRVECYDGSSFLSQNSRFVVIPANARSCTIRTGDNKERDIIF